MPPAPFALPRSDEEWEGLGAQIKTRMNDARHEILTREAGEDDLVLQAVREELKGKEPEACEPTRETDENDLVLQAIREDLEAKKSEGRKPMTLDDIAERVQQIIDDPTLAGDERDDGVLQAVRVRLKEDERPASRDYEPAPAQTEQQSDKTESRTTSDQPASNRAQNYAREQEQEREDENEDGHTLEQGGGGRERSLQ